jgi:hypothetical protein
MQDLGSFTVDEVEPPIVSGDGNLVIVTFKVNGDSALSLAIPQQTTDSFIGRISSAMGEAARRRFADPNHAYVLSADGWAVTKHTETGALAVSYLLPGGTRVAFRFSPQEAERLAQELLSQP